MGILFYDERLITFKNCHKVDTHFNPWNRAQRSMAHPLRAASRLVAMAQMPKPLTTGIISAVPRHFGTTSLRTSNYQAIEGKRGSLLLAEVAFWCTSSCIRIKPIGLQK